MGATQFSTEDGRRLDLSCHLLHDNGVSTGADVTVISAFEHEMRAQDTAATQIKRHGDDEKVKKHAAHVEAQGARFLPLAFSSLGAWGPAASSWFYGLWKGKMDAAANRGEPVAPIVQQMMWWRGRISVVLMRSTA